MIRTYPAPGKVVLNAQDYGIRPITDYDNTARLQMALDEASSLGGGTVWVPAGTYDTYDNLSLPSGVTLDAPNSQATLRYHPQNDGVRRAVILLDGVTGAHVRNVQTIHCGSRCVNRELVEGRDGAVTHGYGIWLKNSQHCSVTDCTVTEGLYGIYLLNSVDAIESTEWSTNLYNMVRGCRASAQFNAGYYQTRGYGCTVDGYTSRGCGYDGLKFTSRNRRCIATNIQSHGNGRDGADFFDGFIEGVISNVVCSDNSGFGVEFKGSIEAPATDYVFRDTQVSNVHCSYNGVAGSEWFPTGANPNVSITNVRSVTFDGLYSIGATEDGIRMTNVQNCKVNCFVGRNTRHGLWLDSSSDNQIEVAAVSNSYVDGVVQNGTYDGVSVTNSSSSNVLIVLSENSAAMPGGQRYGLIFDSDTCVRNLVLALSAESNVTGPLAAGTDTLVLGVGDGVVDTGITVANAYDTQRVLFVNDLGNFATRILATNRWGAYNNGGNAELAASRPDGATVVVQAQATKGVLYTEGILPLDLGVGNARIRIDNNGDLYQVSGSGTQRLGLAATPWAKIYSSLNFLGTASDQAGTGSPEGVVTAVVGSTYRQTDGSLGTAFWRKVTGSGNTGWVAIGNVASILGGSAGRYLRDNGSTGEWSTLTLPNAATTGDVFTATASNTGGVIPAPAAGKLFRSAGVSTLPAWSTFTFPDTAAAGDVLYASATNVWASLAKPVGTAVFTHNGTVPSWTTTLARAQIPSELAYEDEANTFSQDQSITRTGANPMLNLTRSSGVTMYLQAQASVGVLNSNASGGGVAVLRFSTGGAGKWEINTSSHLIASTDATSDIGDATHRPRDLYTSRDATLGRNVVVNGTASLGGGVGVMFIGNAGTNPSTNPTGGSIPYVDAADGKLKCRTANGVTTTIAA